MEIRDRIKELRRVKASELKPSPVNWRKHPKFQREALRGVLEEIGYADALIAREVDGGLELIDGHLRSETTPEMEVPVLVLDLDEDEARKLIATLDPLVALADTDKQILEGVLKSIEMENEMARKLLDRVAEENRIDLAEPGDGGDEFDCEPENKPQRCKYGDLWQLGDHRLLCGDSTKAEDVARVMAGEKADTLVTSPPYWAEQEYDHKTSVENMRTFMGSIANVWTSHVTRRIQIQTGHTSEQRIGWGATCAKVLLDAEWVNAFAGVGWKLRHRRCWAKEHFGGSRAGPETDYVDEAWEVILILWDPKSKHTGQECIPSVPWTMSGVWRDIGGHRKEGESNDHPCPFPIELASRMIAIYSTDGAIVCDPFLGSGTTMIAAQRLNRRCFGLEIAPRYCDVILARWEAETRQEAKLLERVELATS